LGERAHETLEAMVKIRLNNEQMAGGTLYRPNMRRRAQSASLHAGREARGSWSWKLFSPRTFKTDTKFTSSLYFANCL